MHEEREVIMRKVMVELNQFCYDRGVCLTYIDMRWGTTSITFIFCLFWLTLVLGITKDMGDNAKTILTCLREVDHARPYFVGILGERYGWHKEVDEKDELLTKTFKAAESEYHYGFIVFELHLSLANEISMD
jgi:hypothetical protein